MTDKQRTRWLDITVAVTVILNLALGIYAVATDENMYFIALSIYCMDGLILGILHGVPRMGWKNLGVIMVISGLTSLVFESLGINTGFLFSKYIYTDFIPGPKLFGFNLFSVVGYGIGVYLVWAVAQAAVGQFSNRFRRAEVITVPIIAALLVVSIDFATDPFLATINGAYHWEKPGVYYGIPWQNYMGWYVMAYVLYQLVALYLWWRSRGGHLPDAPPIAGTRRFWIYPPLLFACLFIQMPFNVFITASQVTNINHQVFMTNQVYWGVMIVYIGAIVTPNLMIIFRNLSTPELKPAKR